MSNQLSKKKTSWRDAFSVKRLTKSFRHALRGVAWLFRHEANARIHLIFTLLVVVAGLFFQITRVEWIASLLCIAMVLSLEALNTALEHLSNEVTNEYSEKIRNTKDLSAGAVLIAAIIAAIIGLTIFTPYLFSLFSN